MSDKTFPAPAGFATAPRPPITLAPVESKRVGAIGYDPTTKTLAVQFKAGARAIYHYPGVEPETFEEFKAAKSLGTYFGQNLQKLPFEKYPNEDQEETQAQA